MLAAIGVGGTAGVAARADGPDRCVRAFHPPGASRATAAAGCGLRARFFRTFTGAGWRPALSERAAERRWSARGRSAAGVPKLKRLLLAVHDPGTHRPATGRMLLGSPRTCSGLADGLPAEQRHACGRPSPISTPWPSAALGGCRQANVHQLQEAAAVRGQPAAGCCRSCSGQLGPTPCSAELGPHPGESSPPVAERLGVGISSSTPASSPSSNYYDGSLSSFPVCQARRRRWKLPGWPCDDALGGALHALIRRGSPGWIRLPHFEEIAT